MSLSQAEIAQFSKAISDDVIAMNVARLYECAQEWKYNGLWGPICLVKTKGGFAFKLLDFNSKQLLWEYVLGDIKYAQDLPHFHSFIGKNSVMGLSFASEKDAQEFANQVLNRDSFVSKTLKSTVSPTAPVVKETKEESKSWFKSSKKQKDKPKIDKSMISAPENFQHLSHVGFDPKTGFSASNIPMEWKIIFQKAGITEDQLADKRTAKVVAKFMKQHELSASKPPPPLPPSRADSPKNERKSPGAGKRGPPPPPPPSKRGPPPPVPPPVNSSQSAPPPPPVLNRQTAPPPPPANRGQPPPQPARAPAQPPVISSVPSGGAPPPPPMPGKGTATAPSVPELGGPPPPPPMPIMGGPPPPPMPAMGGPPPPPMPGNGMVILEDSKSQGALAPPPPMPNRQAPPTVARSNTTSASDGRNDLLSSIRNAGVSSLKRTQTERPPAASPEPEEESGEDLAAALKAALSRRKGAVGESDSDEDSEDWD